MCDPVIRYSIIIPTFNRARYLKNAIESLIKQEFKSDKYEIIVVDNASTDNTKEITEDAIQKNPYRNIRYIYEPVPGLLSGRHCGAFKARGDFLIFIDDDIEVSNKWLWAISDAFQNPDVHLVGGKNLPKYETTPPEWLAHLWSRNKNIFSCGYTWHGHNW